MFTAIFRRNDPKAPQHRSAIDVVSTVNGINIGTARDDRGYTRVMFFDEVGNFMIWHEAGFLESYRDPWIERIEAAPLEIVTPSFGNNAELLR